MASMIKQFTGEDDQVCLRVGKGHIPQPKQGIYTLPAKGYARDGHTAEP